MVATNQGSYFNSLVMPSYKPFTFEENLAATNEELLSNWVKFASFIKTYEDIPWFEASRMARDLLKADRALEYILDAREQIKVKPLIPEHSEGTKPKKSKKKSKEAPLAIRAEVKIKQTIYERNYQKLMQIAPGLENKLLNQSENDWIYGKSKVSGYMDLSLEQTESSDGKHYIALAHYFIQNGDMVPNPDMLLLLDTTRKMVEALEISTQFYYRTVYDDRYKRTLLNPEEKKSQNVFLQDWLNNLIARGYQIKWKKEEIPQVESEQEISLDVIEKATENTPEVTELQNTKDMKEEAFSEAEKEEFDRIAKHWRALAAFIVAHEGISQEEADKKALELKRQGLVDDYYAERIALKSRNVSIDTLYRSNYASFKNVVPDFRDQMKRGVIKGLLKTKKSKFKDTVYELVYVKDIGSIRSQFLISEIHQGDIIGYLFFTINRTRKMLWVASVDQEFFKFPLFNEDKSPTEAETRSVNERLSRFLDFLENAEYAIEWTDKEEKLPKEEEMESIVIDETPQAKTIKLTVSKRRAEAMKKDAEKKKERKERGKINEEIPDFEIGKVKLTEAHKRAGLTQEDIDWINKHKQGLVLRPKNNAINNTQNLGMDLAIKAKKPGFRISATGKLYYEGRSNRSDLTDAGL